jgi:hypothetical protein
VTPHLRTVLIASSCLDNSASGRGRTDGDLLSHRPASADDRAIRHGFLGTGGSSETVTTRCLGGHLRAVIPEEVTILHGPDAPDCSIGSPDPPGSFAVTRDSSRGAPSALPCQFCRKCDTIRENEYRVKGPGTNSGRRALCGTDWLITQASDHSDGSRGTVSTAIANDGPGPLIADGTTLHQIVVV